MAALSFTNEKQVVAEDILVAGVIQDRRYYVSYTERWLQGVDVIAVGDCRIGFVCRYYI